jgi:SAM-dependent methyltransferase
MAHFTLLQTEHAERPSAWMVSHAESIKPKGTVLDLAAGTGRNARWLAQAGFEVTAIDIDSTALSHIKGIPGITTLAADLESGPWPFPDQQYDAIVVCRYLHRPLFPQLLTSLVHGGILIYETFMVGHEAHGRPTNPDFLLRENELKQICDEDFDLIAFEQGYQAEPKPAVMQRICAKKV